MKQVRLPRRLRPISGLIEDLGLTVGDKRSGGHFPVLTPDGRVVMMLPHDLGNGRARLNLESQLKRAARREGLA
jgi:hypothetical protein